MTRISRLSRQFHRLRCDAADAFDSLENIPLWAINGYEDLLGPLCSWGRYLQRGLVVLETIDSLPDASLFSPPLRRSIIEHAVMLAALADEPDLYPVLQRKMQTGATKVQKATEAIGLSIPSDLARVVSWEISEEGRTKDKLGNFAPLCEHLGDMGSLFYLDWLQETQLSHVGMLTAHAYLKSEPGKGMSLTVDSQQTPRDALRDAAGGADVMVLAVDKISQVLQGDPLRTQVAKLNERKMRLLAKAGVE